MYYSQRYCKEETASGTVLQKSGSSQIFFKDFDYNYYNGSLKYEANRTLFFYNTCHSKLKK